MVGHGEEHDIGGGEPRWMPTPGMIEGDREVFCLSAVEKDSMTGTGERKAEPDTCRTRPNDTDCGHRLRITSEFRLPTRELEKLQSRAGLTQQHDGTLNLPIVPNATAVLGLSPKDISFNLVRKLLPH